MRRYHFLQADMTSCQGNEKPWMIDETRHANGKIILCSNGYHSSPTWYDGLYYANGPVACIVDVPRKGTILDSSKSASPSRTLVNARDANKVLRLWACDCAERALKKTKDKDQDSWNAIAISRLYAEGKATLFELADAWTAAWASVTDTRQTAKWAAANSATRIAVWNTAWITKWATARGDGEIKWQKHRLNWYMKKLFEEEKNE